MVKHVQKAGWAGFQHQQDRIQQLVVLGEVVNVAPVPERTLMIESIDATSQTHILKPGIHDRIYHEHQ